MGVIMCHRVRLVVPKGVHERVGPCEGEAGDASGRYGRVIHRKPLFWPFSGFRVPKTRVIEL